MKAIVIVVWLMLCIETVARLDIPHIGLVVSFSAFLMWRYWPIRQRGADSGREGQAHKKYLVDGKPRPREVS